MSANAVKVFMCFCLFLGVQFIVIDAQGIRRIENSVLNDAVPNIARDEDGSTDIVFNNQTNLFILSSDFEKMVTNRTLAEAQVIENRDAENALKIVGDKKSDRSFEMAESHIFRPLFRYRVRKSSNVRAWF